MVERSGWKSRGREEEEEEEEEEAKGRKRKRSWGSRAINQKVVGSIPHRAKMTLLPWARHFT